MPKYRFSYSVPERRFDTLEPDKQPQLWDTRAPRLSDWKQNKDGSWTGTSADFCIYFIQEGEDGPIKIGRSTLALLASRVSSMQTGNSRTMHVRRVVVGGPSLEKLLHERLAEHRIRGEWFRPHPDVLGLLERTGEGAASTGAIVVVPPTRRQKEKIESSNQANQLLRAGLSVNEVASLCGVTTRTIRRWRA